MEWIIAFYWAHSKEPMTGFKVYLNKNSFEVSERTTVVWWHVDSGNDASFFRDGHAPVDTEKRLKVVEPGSYTIQTKKAHGIIFAHSTICLLYTSPSPRDLSTSRMPSSA